MLQDASRFRIPQIPDSRGSEWVHHAPTVVSLANLGAETAPHETVKVSANHGRWLIDCPDCSGAQLACRTDHRFMCNECGNAVVGGLYRRVEWPADADRIEKVLSVRPLANQNWRPGETIEDLRDENTAVLGGWA